MKAVTVATLVHLKGTMSPVLKKGAIPTAFAFAREQSSREGGMNSLKVENIDGKYHELHHSECRTREVQAAIESKLLNIWHFSWFCTTF